MGSKLFQKAELLKKLKMNENKMAKLISEGIIREKENYSEDDLNEIKIFIKNHPISRSDIKKRFKIDDVLFIRFIEMNLIRESFFYNEKDLRIFQSFTKLKRLGYKEENCLKVLNDIGVPREENLAEDDNMIQLKDLSAKTEITERTIKFYEKESLIKKPRIYKNKRFYERRVMGELELIRDLQNLGYKLNDIFSFLKKTGSDNDSVKTEAVNNLVEELKTKKKIIKDVLKKVEEL